MQAIPFCCLAYEAYKAWHMKILHPLESMTTGIRWTPCLDFSAQNGAFEGRAEPISAVSQDAACCFVLSPKATNTLNGRELSDTTRFFLYSSARVFNCNSPSLALHVHKHKDGASHECPPAAAQQWPISKVWSLRLISKAPPCSRRLLGACWAPLPRGEAPKMG